jgi:N-acetylmuramoyl-L-alanine amidase
MKETISHPSPNFEARRLVAAPSLVVLHYTGMVDGPLALKRLCDAESKVSAHYLVEEDGRIFALVNEGLRAWHAGVSFWRGITDINSHSIGIEIVNPGHEFGYRAFPSAQIQAVTELCKDIARRYALPAEAFLAHSDIAPLRKQDPGELFDWEMLAKEKIGAWPTPLAEEQRFMKEEEAQELLARYGYAPVKNRDELKTTITAFQRRFDPKNVSGDLLGATPARLRALVRESGR